MRPISRTLIAAAAMLAAAIGVHADARSAAPVGVSATARQELPEGPGKTAVARICAGCHDLTFTVSTRETEDGWTRIVNDMRSKGADGTEEEFAQIVAYLTKHMGKPELPAAAAVLPIRPR